MVKFIILFYSRLKITKLRLWRYFECISNINLYLTSLLWTHSLAMMDYWILVQRSTLIVEPSLLFHLHTTRCNHWRKLRDFKCDVKQHLQNMEIFLLCIVCMYPCLFVDMITNYSFINTWIINCWYHFFMKISTYFCRNWKCIIRKIEFYSQIIYIILHHCVNINISISV